MRLSSLRLLAWGRFEREELDLGPAGALTVVYGPNEAGKSTALRALSALLFGIPRGTPDAYLHGPTELRVGGRLELDDGSTLDLVRRRGARPPLVDAAGKAVTEERLSALLGGVGRDGFATMFGLDHVRLRDGAQALASGRGELGEALLSAATGTVSLHRTLAELRGASEAIYTPRAPRRPLLSAVRAFHESKRRVRELEVLPHGWLESEARIDEEDRRERELEAARAAVAEERARIRSVREVAPLLARRAVLERTLDALAHVRDVTTDVGGRREELERELERWANERQALEARISEVERALTELPDASFLRGREAQLERLRAAVARLDARTPARERALAERSHAAEVGGGERDVDPRLAPLALREAELRPLAREELRIRSRLEALSERQVSLSRKVEALPPVAEGALRSSVESDDELRRALHDARAASSAELGAGAAQRVARAEAERALLLARVPGGAAALANLPTSDALELLELERAELSRLQTELATKRAWCLERREGVVRALGAVRAAGPLPDLGALAAARGERARLLQAIVSAEGHGQRARLAQELERVLEDVDRRIESAANQGERLQRATSLEQERHALDAELVARGAAERELAQRAAAVSARLGGLSLAGARLLEVVAGDLARTEAELDAARAGAARVAARAVGAAQLLQTLLGTSSPTPIALAEVELARRERARLDADAAAAERRAIESELGEVKAALAAAALERSAFELAWRGVLSGLGVGEAERAPGVAEAVEGAAQLRDQARRRAARVELELAVAEADEALHEVDTLSRELAGENQLAGLSPRAAAARILALAQIEANERGPREVERATAWARLDKVEQEVASARARLEALALEVGASGPADLARVEADVARSSEAAREVEQLGQRISGRLEGREAELLELLALPPSALADEAARLEEREAELDGELRRSRQRAAGARVGQERMGKGQSAEAEAETAETSLAEVRGLAFEWAVQRVMLALAAAEMERYRAEHKGPLLERASSALRALTGGAYLGVDAVVEGGIPSLVCLRRERRGGREGAAQVGIPALSDGTLDQLYLALRIATWEAHGATRVPLPVVLDDVLVHFDDQRSRGALVALGELARTLQVVVFTHHLRVLELAREAVEPGVLHEVSLRAG